MPEVSIIIPTYNSARYVTMAVESVLAQTFRDYELIVVDDGSTDETRQVLQEYEGKLTYIYQDNQERSAARNNGIRASSGRYIAFIDADDVWVPDKLIKQVAVLDQSPSAVLAHCQFSYIDPEGNPIQYCGKRIYYDENVITTPIAERSRDLFLGDVVAGGGSTTLVRRSLFDEVGFFDETLNFGEDWDMWTRLSRKGSFAYIPEPLVQVRVYSWRRVLAREASEKWVSQQLRVIQKAVSSWAGDQTELDELRALGIVNIYIRAALANFQLDHGAQGQVNLKKAISLDPYLMNRDRLLQLAIDRAKLIETETGSYKQAEAFIHTLFANLPGPVSHLRSVENEALSWLYIGGAFEQRKQGNTTAVRRLLSQGIIYAPRCLKNRGVLSLTLEAWLGKRLVDKLRSTQPNFTTVTERSADVQS